jgi:hypothetical protein
MALEQIIQSGTGGSPSDVRQPGAPEQGVKGNGETGGSTADQTAGAQGPGGGAASTDSGLAVLFGQPEATSETGAKGNQQTQEAEIKLPEWTAQIPKDFLKDSSFVNKLQSFKNLGEFVSAFIAAEKRQTAPGKDAKPEEIQKFYEGLGKPKEAAAYTVAQEKDSADFIKTAFDLNLTDAQASALWQNSKAQIAGLQNDIQARQKKDFIETEAMLHKEYGEKYDESIALLQKGLGKGSISRMLAAAGLMGKPEIIRAFIELGRATSEGFAPPGNGGPPMPDSVLKGRGFTYKSEEEYFKHGNT